MTERLLRTSIPLAFFSLVASTLNAQCPGCMADQSCTVSPAFPTLCPQAAPDATAGQPYEADFTFWMPPTFTDPGSGFTVTFQQMTITNVSGLPFGLQFQASSPSGIYYPQQNAFGCARICGTPIGAGTFPITISIVAAVTVSGINLDVPQEFVALLIVLPGTGGNTSFTYSPISGCGSVLANFQALIDASPAPMSYAWNFGNGTTSTLQTPPQLIYSQAGSYVVSLVTTIGGYVLNSVTLTGTNNNWCGDIEEPNLPIIGCTGSPDPYFILTNSTGATFTSTGFDNTTTATWTNLGVLLNSPPYSISFYDADAISTDDLLGTFNIPANGAGNYFINVAGGTTGSLVISNEPQQVYTDSDTIIVFPLPTVLLSENGTTGELCVEDTELAIYTWVHNGVEVPEANGPCFIPTGPGQWQVVGTNGFGCVDTSNTVVVCPVFEIVRNGNVLFVPSGYLSYSWTFNGAPIAGSDAFIFLQGDGTYGVTVDAGDGCIINRSFVWSTVGIDEQDANPIRMAMFPVPSDGRFTVVAEGLSSATAEVTIMDMTGRTVRSEQVGVVAGRVSLPVSLTASQGTYLVRITAGEMVRTMRMALR